VVILDAAGVLAAWLPAAGFASNSTTKFREDTKTGVFTRCRTPPVACESCQRVGKIWRHRAFARQFLFAAAPASF